jgi:hypothetical protein
MGSAVDHGAASVGRGGTDAAVASARVIRLEAATVLLQWAVGGMAFCWFTTRRRTVGLGYGWLLRGVYAAIAFGALAAGLLTDVNPVREASAAATGIACLAVLAVSVARKSAGVRGQRVEHDRRSARVAAMTGITRDVRSSIAVPAGDAPPHAEREFDPLLDLVPVAVGLVGLLAAAVDTDSEVAVSVLRTLVGAAFLGAITDAMLLGHWYLVQPGLPRRLLHELVDAVIVIWPLEVVAMLIPTGMFAVWSGSIDDGWGGMLGWIWAACAVTTIVLVLVTKAALRERQYSAVMAATGLLYLAILTAFGTDIVARAVLSP